jgi:hypothetical protein
MAQVWLTYQEMGILFGRSATEAREDAIEAGWARRRCRDGSTRVKLPEGSAHLYMVQYAQQFMAAPQVTHPVHRLQERLESFGRGVEEHSEASREDKQADPMALGGWASKHDAPTTFLRRVFG